MTRLLLSLLRKLVLTLYLCLDIKNIHIKIFWNILERANQISLLIRDELDQKLKEFTSVADSLEEVFENREQIELSRFYERLPKPTLIAAQEYVDNKLFHRKAIK